MLRWCYSLFATSATTVTSTVVSNLPLPKILQNVLIKSSDQIPKASIEEVTGGKYIDLTHGRTFYILKEPSTCNLQQSTKESIADESGETLFSRDEQQAILESFPFVSQNENQNTSNPNDKTPKQQPPLIVFVHGASMFSFIWERFALLLVERGYRVLLFDLYGHGYSHVPDVQYSVELFKGQLEELMIKLDLIQEKEELYVIGHSLGGLVATEFYCTV